VTLFGRKFIIISALCLTIGCRAFNNSSNGDTNTSVSQTQAGETSTSNKPNADEAAATNTSEDNTQPIDINDNFRIDLLGEALGKHIITQLEPKLINYQANIKSSNTIASTESGHFSYSQTIMGSKGGKLELTANGNYQKIKSTSGETDTYFEPSTLNIDGLNYNERSECGHEYKVNGHVRCILQGNYKENVQKLNISGQCYTHTGGTLDNLKYSLSDGIHKVRYTVTVNIVGTGTVFESYKWGGSTWVDGIPTKTTHPANGTNICD